MKKYYGAKLREDFINGEVSDYLLRQDNGFMIFTFFVKLLVRVAKSNLDGYLRSEVGEMVVEWTPETIQQDLVFFSLEQVEEALEKLRLVGILVKYDNLYKILDFDKYIFCETADAERKREARKRLKGNGSTKEQVISTSKNNPNSSGDGNSGNVPIKGYYSGVIKEKVEKIAENFNERYYNKSLPECYMGSHKKFFKIVREAGRYPTVKINGYPLDTNVFLDKIYAAYSYGDGKFLNAVVTFVDCAIGKEKVIHTLYYYLNSFYNAAVTGVVAC